MIKAIVFDCFGVLVGSGFWDVYDSAGGDSVKDAEFIHDMLTQANLGQINNSEFNHTIAERIGVSVEEYRAVVIRKEQPNQQLLQYIADNLHGTYKIGLLSNANKGVIERKLSPDHLSLFESKVISGEVGILKPDPKIFKLSASQLGVELNEILFIDDLEQYLEGAKKLGIQTAQYVSFEDLRLKLNRLLGLDFTDTERQ